MRLDRMRGRVVTHLRTRGSYRRWVLWTALAGMFATTFPITILTVSLGDIALDFGVSEKVMTWVISAPLLASAMALPIMGKLGDLHGHRRVFLVGFGLATVVAALTASAWEVGALIGFRTIAQVIGSATQPSSMALIMAVHDPGDRVKAMGWWSLVAAGAPAVGLVAGGPLVEAVGWRMVFVLQAVFALVAFAAAGLVLGETRRRERVRFDVAGAATLTMGTGGLMVLLSQGVDWGWTHPAILAAGVIAPVGFASFIRVERGREAPLLPLGYLGRRNVAAPLVVALFGGAAYMGGFILAPLLMRFVLGFSLSTVAWIMVVRPLTYSLSSPVGGQLSTRVGERCTAVAGQGLLAVALTVFAAGAFMRSVPWIVVGLILQGMGNGVARPPLAASLANAVPEEDLGIAAAAQRMTYQIGGAFGIAVLTVIYGGVNAPAPFGRAYVAGAVLGVVALVGSAFLRAEDRSEERWEEDPVAVVDAGP